MTAVAILFMLLAMAIIWGGLALAITFLARNPLPPEEPAGPEEPTLGRGTSVA